MLLELSVGDTLFATAVLLSGLFLLVTYAQPAQRWTSAGVAGFLAYLSLMKGTQLAESLGVLACVLLLAARARNWRRARWILGSFVTSLICWWLAAGQNPLHLPSYFNGLRHIAQGYNEAMALETPGGLLAVGLALLTGLSGLYAWTAWRHRAHPAMLAACALLAGMTFVSWKHGYLRSDNHMLIFLDFTSIVAFTVPGLQRLLGVSAGTFPTRLSGGLLIAAISMLGLSGSQLLQRDRLKSLALDVPARWIQNLHYLAAASEVKEQSEHDLARLGHKFDLPDVRRIVGGRPIDFFGNQLGLLLLNGFNYQPAPMCCGTYHVYNPYFKERNLRHFTDPGTRPQFILLKGQTIDSRFAPLDDSLSLLAFLDLYRPISFEDDALLLETDPNERVTKALQAIGTRKIRFGEEIAIPKVSPDELLLFSVSLPASVLGETRAIFYKPPLLFMDTQGEGLEHTQNQRVISASLASPVLLNPTLETTEDYLDLLSGQNRKIVKSFRLHTPQPACFRQDEMVVTFYKRARPPRTTVSALHIIRGHSVFQEPPESMEPAARISLYKGLRVQYLHAPAVITYHLKGDERAVSMVVGIDENAYLQGRTDGVDFYIELESPGQPRQILARRQLQPLTVPADRGTHRVIGILPPAFAPGSKLILRTDPGPDHNGAWDWAFATSIRITHGDFQPEQFPGFGTLPDTVVGTSICRLDVGSRTVTMIIPPGSATFLLNGKEGELTFSGGLLAGSYLQGETDGAAFIIELESSPSKTQRLAYHLLQPRTVDTDRGDQAFRIPLPPHPAGSRLRLRTDNGPAANGAWDWVYISELHLR